MQKISTLWPHLAPFWPYLAPFGQCSPCAHVFASCVRVRARIFTKIFVWVFYYHISLSFKFHTDTSFCCGDIFSDTRYFKVPIRQGENEDNLKNEDDLKNENDLKYEDNLKDEDNLKNDNDLKMKTA